MLIHAPFRNTLALNNQPTALKRQQPTIDHNQFKLWYNYFLNDEILEVEKTNGALEFLQPYLDSLQHTALDALSHLDFEHPDILEQQFFQQHQRTCTEFQHYIQRRQNNSSREFFPSVAHAFEFLYKITPTKWVDGAWLYSCLKHSHSPTHCDLTLIYLEELGLGDPRANHVTLYQQLLDQYELNMLVHDLDDTYYEQAAIQCALAYLPESYLPVVIGFNLGYEQLPLHLMITNYELKELGIDPQYFNLHITIDNAHNGHARRALDAFKINFAQSRQSESFLKWVKLGYLLNDQGKSSTAIVQELNPKQQVIQILQKKAVFGQMIHNEKCKFKDRTINDWLSQPSQINQFLDILIEKKWIILGAPAENSRFWQMIHATHGKMFGVFNPTEQQFIKDWIEGNTSTSRLKYTMKTARDRSHASHSSHRMLDTKHMLEQHLKASTSMLDQLSILRPYLAPHVHHQDIGLWATQHYAKLLFPYQSHHQLNISV